MVSYDPPGTTCWWQGQWNGHGKWRFGGLEGISWSWKGGLEEKSWPVLQVCLPSIQPGQNLVGDGGNGNHVVFTYHSLLLNPPAWYHISFHIAHVKLIFSRDALVGGNSSGRLHLFTWSLINQYDASLSSLEYPLSVYYQCFRDCFAVNDHVHDITKWKLKTYQYRVLLQHVLGFPLWDIN